jgi:hypothetical protein
MPIHSSRLSISRADSQKVLAKTVAIRLAAGLGFCPDVAFPSENDIGPRAAAKVVVLCGLRAPPRTSVEHHYEIFGDFSRADSEGRSAHGLESDALVETTRAFIPLPDG